MNRDSKTVLALVLTLMTGARILSPTTASAQGSVTPKPCVAEPGEMTIAFGDLINCDITPVGDVDIYRFQGSAGQTVRVQLTQRTGPGTPYFEIYDPTDVRIAYGGSWNAAIVAQDVKLTGTGTYTIRVADVSYDQTMAYQLYLQRVIPPLSPTPISFGQVLTGDLGFQGEVDLYTFSGVAGQSVRIQLSQVSGPGTPLFELYDPSDARIAYGGSWNAAIVAQDVKLTGTGTYTIRAEDVNLDQTMSYEIYLQRVTPPLSPTPISFGQVLTGNLSFRGKVDLYTFSGVAGQSVRIQLSQVSGPGTPFFELYDPSDARIAYGGSWNAAIVAQDVKLTGTGTYTIRAEDVNLDQTMSYELYLQRVIPPLSPTPISFGQSLNGDLSFRGKVDFYTFSGVAGQTIRIQLTQQTGPGTPYLELYDPANARIASAGSWNSAIAAQEVKLTATGTYTIRASDVSLDQTMKYTVFLQCLSQCDVTPQPLTITSASPLPNAVVGTPYSQSMTASGGTPPYSWALSAGSLPAGLSLTASGILSGAPTVAGAFGFTVRVTDSLSASATEVFALSVFTPNPVPAITGLSPVSMLAGTRGLDIIVNGTSFIPGATVRWNNQERSTTFLSSVQLRAFIPAADLAGAGTAAVTAFNPAPGGGSSNPMSFPVTNPVPSLCCLNPISVVAGSPAFQLAVHGSNFVPTSTVSWNGSIRPTTFVNPTELRAAVTANDVITEGTANVTVSSPAPGGGTSRVQAIPVITLSPGSPSITSVSPDSLPAGGEGFTLTINGTGFVQGSVAQFNGQSRATMFVSTTQLTVAIPASDIATAFTNGITVVNPGSGGGSGAWNEAAAAQNTSNASVVTVLNPVPVLSGVSPGSAKAGSGAFSVSAEGEKFVSTSTLRWNGSDRPTTFTSHSRLGGTIQSGDLAVEGTGTGSVAVSNPGPGGGASNSLTFTIRTNKAASTALYYPRLVTNKNETTGIAVANLSGADATLTLWAFDKAGSEEKGPEITNPASVSIKGVEQLPILDWQLFGPGLPAKSPVGWLRVESTVPKVAGFFLTFNDSLTTMDGASVSSATTTSFVLPEIEDQGFTQIRVANPDASEAEVTFELRGSDGKVRAESVARKVNASGTVAETLSELFPGVTPDGSDYVWASANRGVVAFEFLGKTGEYVEALNGQDANMGSTTLYSPQYVVGGGYRTTLSVVNLESVGGTVALELIGDDGNPLGTRQVMPIEPRGKLYITDQKFFLDPGQGLIQGYVKVISSGPKLTGSVVFGDPERKTFSSSLPLVANLLNSVVFGHIASNSTYFTGIAILNPNEADATATIDVYDRNGNLLQTKTESIGAKRRVSKLVTQYFANLVGREMTSGYIKVIADKGVASFALFGTQDLSVLAAIPPQVVP